VRAGALRIASRGVVAIRWAARREISAWLLHEDRPRQSSRTKKATLERALSSLPERVRFVPTDFNQRQLEEAMAVAGYRTSVPTLFLWEGVTNYLTEAAVDATLGWCSKAALGSRLVFTYVHRAVLDDPQSFIGTEKLLARRL
jgi:methyltransferase (TIGR00027 family)